MELLWVWKTCMEVVSQHFLPTLFSAKPLRRSAKNRLRPRVQRSENVGKQKRRPCGSGSEGTYPCGAQAPMWWPNGHIKMRSFQMRQFQRKSAKRSWQRMMTSWSLFHPQKQQPGSVFWSGNFLWIMRIACEGTPCTLPWHLMSGQTFLESLWTRLTLTNQFTIYWKRGQRPRPSFAVLKTFQHSKWGPGSLTPVGSGCIRGYLRMSYGVGETVTLQHLKVQREHQRRGIATLMLEGGLRLAREHHEWSFKQISLKVFLRNRKALAFYERMGFQHSRPLPKRPRSALAEWSLMKKEIWGMGWSLGAHHHYEKMYFSLVTFNANGVSLDLKQEANGKYARLCYAYSRQSCVDDLWIVIPMFRTWEQWAMVDWSTAFHGQKMRWTPTGFDTYLT